MPKKAHRPQDDFTKALRELQEQIAAAQMRDYISRSTGSRSSSSPSFLVFDLEDVEIRMEGDKKHAAPHVHLKIGKRSHDATYEIKTGERLAGTQSKKEKVVKQWIASHVDELLEIWDVTQAGGDPHPYVERLSGKKNNS